MYTYAFIGVLKGMKNVLKCAYVMYGYSIVTLHARTKRGRFPDSKAKILGRAAKSIPNKLTT